MRKTILLHKVALTHCMVMTLVITMQAQRITIVSGKVLNLPEGERKARPFPAGETIVIWAFNTVATAKDAVKALETGVGSISYDGEAVAGSDGYYEISVAETGALLIRVQMRNELVEVKGRREIDVSVDGGIALAEVEVTAASKVILPKPKAGKIVGNKLIVDNTLPIPAEYGADNRRLILQPFIVDCMTEDTVSFMRPKVMDGIEYGLTQDRRMLYDISRDPLARFLEKRELTGGSFELIIRDSVPIPDPKKTYSVSAKISISDYTQKTFANCYPLSTCKIKRPLQFLEFTFPRFELAPMKYKETPRRERRDTKGNISLTFLVGKGELDDADTTNIIQMAKLQNDLMEIINGEGTTLKEFKITGISSPEGRYASNIELSKRRIAFALNKITSVIPHSVWERVLKHPSEVQVATWGQVADLLEQDSLTAEANEIREIEAKYKDRDAQFAAVRRLPYYDTYIKDRLPKLRTVQYEYKHEIFRELNPEEIVDRYYNDPNYSSGKKSFSRYEYWNLFQRLKHSKDAEKLYRRAYEETMTYDAKGKPVPWLLAANNLAVALIDRDTFDIEILKPLIDLKRKVNSVDRFNDGFYTTEREVNPEAVVANQLAMYIRAYNFEDASILARMLPNNDRFRMIKAFADCLGGYYDYRGAPTVTEAEERKKVFTLVRESSPLNNVVMLMAMEMGSMDKEAKEALEKMPESSINDYLKLILYIRDKKLSKWDYSNAIEFDEACKMLDKLRKKEAKYYKIAQNDGEFSKEFMEYFDSGDWDLGF